MSILISIDKLLSGKYVENDRMEFKKGWNPVSTMRTICAFANDFGNEGSGYIMIGIEEENGRVKRPVKGFDPDKFEKVQKELIGYCNLIQPSFFPRLSFEEVDNKQVLVIWVPAGSNRPYKVPDDNTEKADKVYNYPYPAIEEALANAVYHRNYELRDPIEVRVLPSSIEIISYSGIDPSLKQSDFEKGVVRTRRYRNRRIGSFLKDLGLTEGKGTGIPIIYKALEDNGSPKPKFDTDAPNRNFFVVEFSVYSNFKDIDEGGSIGGAINLTDRQNEIISIIKSDNKISYRAIAKKLDINDSAVDKHIKLLKEKGILKRVGGTRGHWEVKDCNSLKQSLNSL